ncbi:MAG: HD domain-containing protein [Bacilli bacterium]|nr:HD domain-containing protein [Bacilli bacterium]
MKFKNLKVGDNNIVLHALVVDAKIKQTVNQTPYYGLTLSDGEDLVDARIWTVGIVNTLAKAEIENGNVYKLTVKVNDYAGKNQIIITKIEDANPSEVDLSTFYKTAPMDLDVLKNKIIEAMNSIKNPTLKKIVFDLIGKDADKYFIHQAAITMHHNYLGGLAYHVYSMLQIADVLIKNYPTLNADLLRSGVLIHDIGKTVEITSDKTPSYSKEGNLLGHIVIGLNKLYEVIKDNEFENKDEALALLHMLAAHHGELEYGSPKEPLMYEALALHLIDLMDSKLAGCEEIVKKTEKGGYTSYIPTLGKKALYVPDIE